MSQANADRNLLFGVLALQVDLIEDRQFVDACAGWAACKDQPLADLLVERGWISAEDRRQVESLLERKLKKHGGNARATLGAVAGAEARDALRNVDDPEVRQSISSLPPAAGYVLTETIVPNRLEKRSRYTLTRLHAEGGLGKVWVAHDTDLNRDVALKEIQPEQATHPEMWRRFLKEAQVTGQLEHPNIVPVYELARRPEDGQPFYTMRLVRGRTLREEIAEHHKKRARGDADPVGQLKLLQAFVSVCQAIGYAHSRGVLHRDLKPENVVLGGFGEVIVLDWGLAKTIDDANDLEESPAVALTEDARTEATRAGHLLGSPAYMAPEQAEGRFDLVGTRTDVYGLGAILFEILTGRAPHEGKDTAEIIARILSGETPSSQAVVNSVPPALDAICARAMAKARGDRYPKATALAGDLQLWLADEPVPVYREGWSQRLSRWGRKHRAWVEAGAASFVLVMVMAIGVAVQQYFHADRIRSEQGKTQNALSLLREEQKQTKAALKVVSEREAQIKESHARLEDTLARSLLSPVGLDEYQMNDAEVEALWQLASGGRRMRQLFVSTALERPTTTRQLCLRADLGMRAALGLDYELHDHAEAAFRVRMRDKTAGPQTRSDATLLGLAMGGTSPEFTQDALQVTLTLLSDTTDKQSLERLSQVVTGLAPHLGSRDAESVALRTLKLMKETGRDASPAIKALALRLDAVQTAAVFGAAVETLRFVGDKRSMDDGFIGPMGEILSTLATRLARALDARSLQPVFIGMNKVVSPVCQDDLALAVVALAPKLSPAEAADASRTLLDAMDGTVNPGSPAAFEKMMSALAVRLAARDAVDAVKLALGAMRKTTNRLALNSYARAVLVLTARFEPVDAKAHALTAYRLIEDAFRETANELLLTSLAEALAALSARLDPNEVASAGRLVLGAMTKAAEPSAPYSTALTDLGDALASMANRLEPEERVSQAAAAVQLFFKAKPINFGPINEGEKLNRLMSHLDAGASSDIARRIIEAIHKVDRKEVPRVTEMIGGTDVSSSWSIMLTTVAERLDAQAASEILGLLLETMSRTTQLDDWRELSNAAEALAARLGPQDAAGLTSVVIKMMENAEYTDQVKRLAKILAAVAGRQDRKTRDLTEAAADAEARKMITEAKTPAVLADLAIAIAALPIEPIKAKAAAVRDTCRVLLTLGAHFGDGKLMTTYALAFRSLAPWLESDEAAGAAAFCVQALARADGSIESDLAKAVMACTARIDPKNRERGRLLLEMIASTPQLFTNNIEAENLSPLLARVAPSAASDAVARILDRLGRSQVKIEAWEVAVAEAVLKRDIEAGSAPFSEQQLVNFLKIPTCSRYARQVIVKQLGRQCGRQFVDVWEFARWAEIRRPDLDLASVPIRPRPFRTGSQ